MKKHTVVKVLIAMLLVISTMGSFVADNNNIVQAAPLVRIAPNPKGNWTKVKTLKYKINPKKDAYSFAFSVGSYLGTSYLSSSRVAAAIASGLSSVFSSKIKGKNVW